MMAGLFWEKSTAGWWLISQANMLVDCNLSSANMDFLLQLEQTTLATQPSGISQGAKRYLYFSVRSDARTWPFHAVLST
jgi:hypothetical protein